MTVNLGTAFIEIQPDFDTFNTRVASAMPGVQRKLSGLSTDTERAHRTTSAFSGATSGLARGLGAAAAAAGAAAAAYISISQAKSAISATTDLAKVTAGLTRNLGLNTKEASRWGTVAYAREIDTKSLTMSFTTLSRQLTEAAAGSETARQAFADIGVTQRDLKRTGGDFQKQLMLVANAFGDAEGGALRQQAAQKLLGRGYQTLLPLFAEGKKSLKEQLHWADKYGTTLDKKTTGKLMDFVGAQRESKAAWLGLQQSFTVAVLPMLTEVQDEFQHLAHIVNNPKLSPDEKWDKATQAITHLVKKWGGKLLDWVWGMGSDLAGSIWRGINADLRANSDRYGAQLANGIIDVWNSAVHSAFDVLNDNPAFQLLLGPFSNLGVAAKVNDLIPTPHITVPEPEDASGKGPLKAAKGYAELAESLADIMKAGNKVERLLEGTGDAAEDAGKGADKGRSHLERYGRGARDNAELASRSLGDHALKVDKYSDYIGRDLDRGERKTEDYRKGADKSYDRAGDSAGRMAKRIGGSVGSAARAVQGAMSNIAENTNEALKRFNVKRLSFAFKTVGNAAGNVLGLQRGGMALDVPGYGSGDTEALHIGGRLAAMIEPGERLFVLNRNASSAMRALEQANRRVPRFAGGGMVTGDTDYLPELGSALNRMAAATHHSIYVQSGRRTMAEQQALYDAYLNGTGNLAAVPNANAPHVRGIAADISPGREVFGGVAGRYGLGFTVPSESWHIELTSAPTGGGMGRVNIPKIKIVGPPGPYRDISQRAADTAWKAARKYIAAKMPIGNGLGGYIDGAGGSVVREAGSVLMSGGLDVSGASAIMGNAYQESTWNPASVEGLWGFHSPPVSIGDVRAYADRQGKPWDSAALQANFLLAHLAPDHSGPSPSYARQLSTMSLSDATDSFMRQWERPNLALANFPRRLEGAQMAMQTLGGLKRQRGGYVPRLAGGGKPGKGKDKPQRAEITGGKIDPKWKIGMIAVRNAERVMSRLKPLVAAAGPIAVLDERIGLAETRAGQDSSPAGSELSAGEITRQIELNRQLVKRLRDANQLASRGARATELKQRIQRAIESMPGGKAMTGKLRTLAQSFNEIRVEMSGLTGKGGRLGEARFNIDTLQSTAAGGTAEPLDIAGLRSVIEAARYGVFDRLVAAPVMHAGGTYRAPAGRLEGPAILADGERVTPAGAAGAVSVVNHFDFDGLGLIVRTEVDGVLAKRERIAANRMRQYAGKVGT